MFCALHYFKHIQHSRNILNAYRLGQKIFSNSTVFLFEASDEDKASSV